MPKIKFSSLVNIAKDLGNIKIRIISWGTSGTIFTILHFVATTNVPNKLESIGWKSLAKEKHSGLLGPFIS